MKAGAPLPSIPALKSRRQSLDSRSDPATAGAVLGFDFGEKRIGVAVGDLQVGIAHPLTTIRAEDNRSRFSAIAAIVEEWHPVRLVVGVPYHAQQPEHEMERLARRFARRLEGRFGITTHLVDERLTSEAAATALREQGVSARNTRGVLDEAAAQQILQAYFEGLRAKQPARCA